MFDNERLKITRGQLAELLEASWTRFVERVQEKLATSDEGGDFTDAQVETIVGVIDDCEFVSDFATIAENQSIVNECLEASASVQARDSLGSLGSRTRTRLRFGIIINKEGQQSG